MTKTNSSAACLIAAIACVATAAHAVVDASGLKLVDARGVPNETERRYVFQGAILFASKPQEKGHYTTQYEKFWAEGSGKWDEKKKEASEGFHFSGSLKGQLATTFKCPKDPWLTKSGGCVLVSAPYSGTKGKNYDWQSLLGKLGRPLSGEAVDAGVAQKLSLEHPNKPPGQQATVPPPKKDPVGPQQPQHPAQQSVVNAGALQLQPTQAPDLTSAPQLEVAGKHAVAWNSALTLTDADVRAKNLGVCRVAFAHVMRNAGNGISGPFSRRWTNQALSGATTTNGESLAPGQTLQRVDTLPLKPGVNELSFVLDPANSIKESDEANNARSLTVTLNAGCGGDASPQQLSADGLRFAPARSATNSRLPAVQVNPGPPTSPLQRQQQR